MSTATMIATSALGLNIGQRIGHEMLMKAATRRCQVATFVLTQVAVGAVIVAVIQ